MAVLDVPAPVRQKAAALGAAGESWLRRLPGLVRELERDWDVVAGEPLRGGTEAYVTGATTRDGLAVVMKLQLPGDATFSQKIRTLESANGRGYARLLRHDEERRAMLMERLGPSLAASGFAVEAQIELLCATLTQAWAVGPATDLDSGADKAGRLAAFIAGTWEELGRPCSESAVATALAFAEARAASFDPDTAVGVHGDAHSGNALRAADGEGFKFVDPESFLAERAYDLGISMREWSTELLEDDALQRGVERCQLLGRLACVAPQPIWEWGFVERVSTGLLALQVGFERTGREMLAVAEVWSDAAGPGRDGKLAPR